MFLVARASGDPLAIAQTLRRVIAGVDRQITITSLQPLDAIVSAAAAQPRFRTAILLALAGLALALAAVGLYGVIGYSVSQRTSEIGIRMALGAKDADVLTMVLREGALLAVAGVATGVLGALALTRTLAGLLYGIAPTDWRSFGLATLCLLTVALVASYVPARRATRVDPLIALRAE
jgi:putative ABC transport system permease protein